MSLIWESPESQALGGLVLAQLSQLALLRGQFCLVEGSKVESIQWGAFAKRL
jgi:hypothetical protein